MACVAILMCSFKMSLYVNYIEGDKLCSISFEDIIHDFPLEKSRKKII